MWALATLLSTSAVVTAKYALLLRPLARTPSVSRPVLLFYPRPLTAIMTQGWTWTTLSSAPAPPPLPSSTTPTCSIFSRPTSSSSTLWLRCTASQGRAVQSSLPCVCGAAGAPRSPHSRSCPRYLLPEALRKLLPRLQVSSLLPQTHAACSFFRARTRSALKQMESAPSLRHSCGWLQAQRLCLLNGQYHSCKNRKHVMAFTYTLLLVQTQQRHQQQQTLRSQVWRGLRLTHVPRARRHAKRSRLSHKAAPTISFMLWR
jgi:hypothetical protein